MTPYIGIASIFANAPKVNDLKKFIKDSDKNLSEQEIANKYKMGFEEWNKDKNHLNELMKNPLTELHVVLQNNIDTNNIEKTGYIYEINITKELKDHIYQSSKMDKDFEFVIDDIDEIKLLNEKKCKMNVIISGK